MVSEPSGDRAIFREPGTVMCPGRRQSRLTAANLDAPHLNGAGNTARALDGVSGGVGGLLLHRGLGEVRTRLLPGKTEEESPQLES